MCWIVNDEHIMQTVFTCCPRHRPLISEMLISDQVVEEIKRVRPNVSQVQLEHIQRNVTHDPNRQPGADLTIGKASKQLPKLPTASAPIPIPTLTLITKNTMQTNIVQAPEDLGSNAERSLVKPKSFVESLRGVLFSKSATK